MSLSQLFVGALLAGVSGFLGYLALRGLYRQMQRADQYLAQGRGGRRFLTKASLIPAGVGAFLAALGMVLLNKGPAAYISEVPGTILIGSGVLALGAFIGGNFKETRPSTALLGLTLQTPVLLLFILAAPIAAGLALIAAVLTITGLILFGVLGALSVANGSKSQAPRGQGSVELLLEEGRNRREAIARQEKLRQDERNMKELERAWRWRE